MDSDRDPGLIDLVGCCSSYESLAALGTLLSGMARAKTVSKHLAGLLHRLVREEVLRQHRWLQKDLEESGGPADVTAMHDAIRRFVAEYNTKEGERQGRRTDKIRAEVREELESKRRREESEGRTEDEEKKEEPKKKKKRPVGDTQLDLDDLTEGEEE